MNLKKVHRKNFCGHSLTRDIHEISTSKILGCMVVPEITTKQPIASKNH